MQPHDGAQSGRMLSRPCLGDMAMAKHAVQCPQCGASYNIDESKLGKRGRCAKCGNSFTLALPDPDPVEPIVAEVVEDQTPPNPLASLVAASSDHALAPQAPKRKSFLEKAKDWADAAARQVNVVYVQGPWGIKANSQMTMVLDAAGLVLRVGIINKQEFYVPYDAIVGITIDTAERLGKLRTLGTWALAGPLAAAFVGFGMKKKDKLLLLSFRDDTGTEVAAVFSKGPGCDIPTLMGRISQVKHDYLASCPEATVVEAEPIVTTNAPDVSDTIAKLAQLRDQGILSEEEFQQKKTELLSRL